MISQRNPPIAAMVVLLKSHKNVVWCKFTSVQNDWIAKDSIGSLVGSRMVRDPQSQWMVNQGSQEDDHVAQTVRPLIGLISGHTREGMQASHLPIAQRHRVHHSTPPLQNVALLLERLRLPLQITEATCEGCQAPLDMFGHHWGSCVCEERQGEAKSHTHRAYDSTRQGRVSNRMRFSGT